MCMSLSLSLYMYIYVICHMLCIYIYIYIERERDRYRSKRVISGSPTREGARRSRGPPKLEIVEQLYDELCLLLQTQTTNNIILFISRF